MAEAGNAGAQRGTPDAGETSATVLAVAGLMLALFLVALDQTIVGTALPQIVADMEGFERYTWVTTAYLLASTAMIPVIGKLGDIYGRKLANGHDGTERERAAYVYRTVVRPLGKKLRGR